MVLITILIINQNWIKKQALPAQRMLVLLMPVRNRTSKLNLWDKSPYPVRYHFALNLGGKKEKNVLKGGPGRNRTCDLADNGSVPVRIHFCIKFLYQWLKRPLLNARSIEGKWFQRTITGKIVYLAYIVPENWSTHKGRPACWIWVDFTTIAAGAGGWWSSELCVQKTQWTKL